MYVCEVCENEGTKKCSGPVRDSVRSLFCNSLGRHGSEHGRQRNEACARPFGILVPAFIISAVVKSARKGNSGDAPVNADEVNRVLESSAQTLTGESTEQKQRSYVKCAYCGMQIEEAAAFCTYCGAAKVR